MAGFFDASSWVADAKPQSGLAKCGQCGLYKTCQSPKMKPAVGENRIMVVGDAPTSSDDQIGQHFAGAAGQLLRSMFAGSGVDLEDCHITYAAICHPKGQSQPETLHVESCRPNLLRAIAEIKPRVIILLGEGPITSLIGDEWPDDVGHFDRWYGWNIPSKKYGAWLCPTYSPSHLLRKDRDAVLRVIVREHIAQAVSLATKKPRPVDLQAFRDRVEVIPHPRDAKARIRDLARASGDLTFDYETTGLKPERKEQEIYTASFSLNGEDTFACRVDETLHKSISRVLQSPKLRKGASNLKFEERWTRQKLGHPVVGWHWDTMLAAHLIDNRGGITSVKFQGYVLLGGCDYIYNGLIGQYIKAEDANGLNRIKQAPLKDLLLYNGVDSLLEHNVMVKQKELLQWDESNNLT